MARSKHILSVFLVVGLVFLSGLSAEARAVLSDCAMAHCDPHIKMSHGSTNVIPAEKMTDHGGCSQNLCHPVVFPSRLMPALSAQVDTTFVSIVLRPPVLRRADNLERPPNA